MEHTDSIRPQTLKVLKVVLGRRYAAAPIAFVMAKNQYIRKSFVVLSDLPLITESHKYLVDR